MTQPTVKGRLDWALLLVVIVASQGLSAFLPGEPARTAIALSTLIMGLAVLPKLGRGLAIVVSNPLVFFVAAWYVASAILAPRPLVAVYFAGVMILMIVFSSLRQGEIDRTIQTFTLATTVSLVPSIVGRVAPIVPVLSGAGKGGGYAGYFPWNSSAGLCAAAAVLCIVVMYLKCGYVWWQIPGVAVALYMLAISRSATAMLSLAAGAAVLGLQAILRRISPQVRPLLIVAVGIAGLFLVPKAVSLLSRKGLADVTDRTESFSGRTQIWQWAIEGISGSPYFGHGTDFWQSVGEWNKSGHNGFLDVALTAGVPTALGLAAIVVLAAVRLTKSSSAMLPLLAFGIAVNLAVSQLGAPAIPALALWLAVGTTLRTGEVRGGSVKATNATVSAMTASNSSQPTSASISRS
jgi:O-antigen ligase